MLLARHRRASFVSIGGVHTQKYHKGLMQICWAHLKRDFKGILKGGEAKQSSEAVSFAKKMEELRKKLMSIWYLFKEGKITRDELIQKTKPVRSTIKRHLKNHKDAQEKSVKTLSFIFHEGVEPTTNRAEREIRPAVQWRKICFGNRSDKCAVLTSRLLTVTRTCWLQKRNSLDFLIETITAFRANIPAPSLL